MAFRSVKIAPSVFAMIHAAKPRAPTVTDPSLPASFRKPTLVSAQICGSNILIAGAQKKKPAIQVYPFGWRLTLLQHWRPLRRPPTSFPHPPPSPLISRLRLKAEEGECGWRQIFHFRPGRKQWLSISIRRGGTAQVFLFIQSYICGDVHDNTPRQGVWRLWSVSRGLGIIAASIFPPYIVIAQFYIASAS